MLNKIKRDKIFYFLALCILYYSLWTLLCHISIVAGITWFQLKISFIVSIIILAYPIHKLSSSLSQLYFNETIESKLTGETFPDLKMISVLIVCAVIFLISNNYTIRYSIATISILLLLFLRKKSSNSEKKRIIKKTNNDYTVVLLIIAAITVLFTLCSHRSDLDDCNFLQIASTTMSHPDMAPFSFEHSLGVHLPQFRFAPYKVSSYELLNAFISDLLKINLLTVYYIIIPAISSLLTVFSAYLLIRWFCDAKTAILATFILVLAYFAWGDTHFAYGNRLFVRLFQGKSLLIAIGVPTIVLSTLMAASQKYKQTLLFSLAAMITCVGFSTNGVITGLIAGAAAIFAGINDISWKTLLKTIRISSILIYPLLCGLYIKATSVSKISFSKLGTVVPINASFGSSIREAIVVIAIISAITLIGKRSKNKQFILLSIFSLMLIMSPLASKIIATLSSANAEWRLAWAAPIPILFAISISLIINFRGNFKRHSTVLFTIAGTAILVLFLLTGKWTLRADNGVVIGKPGPTIEKEYYQTKSIMSHIIKTRKDPIILATPAIAAWIPLTNEESKVIIPGHTYPIMLQTILQPIEFKERQTLLSIFSENYTFSDDNINMIYSLFKKYNVNIIIAHNSNSNVFKWIELFEKMNIKPVTRFYIQDFTITYF